MERLREKQPTGISGSTLRKWAQLFLAAGVIGRGVLQRYLLGIGSVTAEELVQAMQSSDSTMLIVTVSLVLQAMETCALPIFAFLVVEGFQHTSQFKEYLLRVLGAALLTEIPYNLAIGGAVLDFGSRNPVFGTVLVLITLHFYQRYSEKSAKNFGIKALVTLAAIVWGEILGIEFGAAMVIVSCVLWACRKKPMYRNFAGVAASMVCSLTSLFFMASPMAFLPIHFYNGEQGTENRVGNYLFYPVLLLVVGLACKFAF